jgi:drug/metabolite transporter (DMT)-like permease
LALYLGWADSAPAVPSVADFGIFVWMTVGAIVLGLLLWNYGVAKTDLVIASLYSNLAPIIAISLLALAGEPPRASQLAGGALVIGGVVWSEWQLLRVRQRGRGKTELAASLRPPAD